MNSIADIDEFCEKYRLKLYAAVEALVGNRHAEEDCPHEPTICHVAAYEKLLHDIDRHTRQTGEPWHIGLGHMVRATELRAGVNHD